MIWAPAGVFGVTAAVLLAGSGGALGRRWRAAAPEIAVLCMGPEGRRRLRLQLRILQAGQGSGWALRRVAWLEPDGVQLARSPRGRPSDAVAADFAGDVTLWAVYPSDRWPPHAVRLRLTLEHGRRRRLLVVSTVFPALDWSTAARSAPRARNPGEGSHPGGTHRISETRSFAEDDAPRTTIGFA